MLQALLVEDRLLVSQRQAGHPWTQKCVRCGAPTRVARSIPLLASAGPAEEMETIPLALEK